ncbi:MAG: HD domain-containing protein [Dehalococcoidia bacterium]
MPNFVPPSALKPLLARIAPLARDAGVEAYVVGGAVRDALLGRDVHDLDLAVDRAAMAFAQQLAGALGGHFVPLDEENAVARVVLDDGPLRTVDVAELQGTLDEDLRRRDFTVDAMAVPLEGGEVIDPLGGLDDLSRRLVRMTSDTVLDADALRLLRGVRIAAELAFDIEPATAAAIHRRAAAVLEASPERQRDEVARIFALEDVYGALRTLDALGLLDVLLPEVAAGKGVAQPEQFHAYDVFEHAMRAVESLDMMLRAEAPADDGWLWADVWDAFGSLAGVLRTYFGEELTPGRSRRALVKLAGLLHDVAKPQTRRIEADGRVRFFGHADLGGRVAAAVLRRLRFSSREVRFVALLVTEHLRPVQLAHAGEAPTRRALYRFWRDLGDAAPGVVFLALADAAGARGPGLTHESWSRQARYMNSVLVRSYGDEGIVHAPRLLSGRDIMTALGLAEGPAIGRLLSALDEAQAAGEVTGTEGALAFVRELAEAENITDGRKR